jgi:excisionase family DNA binding protein
MAILLKKPRSKTEQSESASGDGPAHAKTTKKPNPPNESINEPLLTIKEAAEKLRLSPKFIYRAIEADELGCHRFGRVIRVSRSDLARFTQQHRK